jgi:hypothetical protein
LKKFYLKGIVYQRGFYLVLHIVGKDHTVWFHDELSRNHIYEKKLEGFSSFDLQSCNIGSLSDKHKNKINWTHNCHAPAMALSSK